MSKTEKMDKIMEALGADNVSRELNTWTVKRLGDRHPFEIVIDMYIARFGEDALSKL